MDYKEISYEELMNYEWFNELEFLSLLELLPSLKAMNVNVETARHHLNLIVQLSISAQLGRLYSPAEWTNFYRLLDSALEFARLADEFSLNGENVPRIPSATCHDMEVMAQQGASLRSSSLKKKIFPARNVNRWQHEFYPWMLAFYKLLTGTEAKPTLKSDLTKKTDDSILLIQEVISIVSGKLSELKYNIAFNAGGRGELNWKPVTCSSIQDRIAKYKKVSLAEDSGGGEPIIKWEARYKVLMLQGKGLKYM